MTKESKHEESAHQSTENDNVETHEAEHGNSTGHSDHKSHSEDHNHGQGYSKADIEHVKKSILIDKYQSLYEVHPHDPWLTTLLHRFLPHKHHSALIDTNVATPDFESLNENEQVDRSLYALWKISKVNPHFFSPSEMDLLEPKDYKIVRLTITHLGIYGVSGYLALSFLHKRLSLKRGLIGFGILAALKAFNYGTEVFYETVRMRPRRKMARDYMSIYGAKKLYEFSKPSYNIQELAHMHNKMHM